jgi:small subunit ribosomal protein S21
LNSRRNNRKPEGQPLGNGLTVEVRNGDFTKALRIFKKKVMEAGIIQEVRDRQEYTKPSEKRAKAKAAGKARWKKKQKQMELDGKLPPSQIRRRK